MRVLAACSLGGSGHLQPLLPFLRAARRRGDEAVVVGPPGIGELVRLAGCRFVVGDEPPEEEIAPIRERLPVAPPAEASDLGNRVLFGELATAAMLPAVRRVLRDWHPDLVLREPCEYASAIAAAELGVAAAQVAISFAENEAASIDAASPALEAHAPGLTEAVRSTVYASRFPGTLDPSPFASTVRYRPEPPEVRSGPPAPWSEGDGPLVYATGGTVLGYMSLARSVYRTLLDALAEVEARVLLTVGHRFDPALLGPLPGNVHVEAWVDQDDVLPLATLVVCHGGSGTVLGALGAGVPLVVVPVFADQFDNASRVAQAGAGTVVLHDADSGQGARTPIRGEDAGRIAGAIEAALEDPAYRSGARRIAAEMAGAPVAGDMLAAMLGRS